MNGCSCSSDVHTHVEHFLSSITGSGRRLDGNGVRVKQEESHLTNSGSSSAWKWYVRLSAGQTPEEEVKTPRLLTEMFQQLTCDHQIKKVLSDFSQTYGR